MKNFNYKMPTKVVFGKDTELETGREVAAAGGTRALVHYGGESAKKSGLLDKVCKTLEEAGIEYVPLGGVKPNPRLSLVREGAALCKKEKLDFVLAVGGGSVIDSAKAIGYGALYDGDVWDFFTGKAKPDGCLPVGVVLTIAAAGSETSDGSVITNEDGWLKRDYGSDMARPRFAVMNPELTYTLPAFQTASGGTDIMMHILERYFTQVTDVELSDGLCETLMRTVMHNLPIALEKPEDYAARADIMWAGSICHNGLLTSGRQGDWASHQIEHELSGMFDVAHGAGLAAVWPSWARYVMKANVGRFAQFAVNIMGCVMNYQEPEKTALEGIRAMEAYLESVGMPVTIRGLGQDVTDEQIRQMADKCTGGGQRTVGNFVKLSREDIEKIYTMAR